VGARAIAARDASAALPRLVRCAFRGLAAPRDARLARTAALATRGLRGLPRLAIRVG